MTILGAVALTVGLAAAPAAGAKKKPKTPKAPKITMATAVSPSATAPGVIAATAFCPARTRALSGGFAAGGPGPVGVPYESVRVGDTAWRTSVLPSGPGAAVIAEVYCARIKGSLTEASVSAPLSNDAPSEASPQATCPGKTTLLSGGYRLAEPFVQQSSVFVFESRRLGTKAWHARALRGFDVPDTTQFTAYAYCFKPATPKRGGRKASAAAKKKAKRPPVFGSRPLTEVVATATVAAAQNSTGTATTSACRAKRKLISGGFATSTPSPNSAAVAGTAHAVGGLWSVTATQLAPAAPSPVTLTAYGYCG
jgi:hypothetical protein